LPRSAPITMMLTTRIAGSDVRVDRFQQAGLDVQASMAMKEISRHFLQHLNRQVSASLGKVAKALGAGTEIIGVAELLHPRQRDGAQHVAARLDVILAHAAVSICSALANARTCSSPG